MKQLFIVLVRIYQFVFSPLFHGLLGQKSACLFSPTCSEYAVQSIKKYGMMHGVLLAGKRILRCQRWFGTNAQ